MSLITLGLLQISPQIEYYIEIAQNEATFNLNFQIISIDHIRIILENEVLFLFPVMTISTSEFLDNKYISRSYLNRSLYFVHKYWY